MSIRNEEIQVPKEFSDINEALAFRENCGDVYFKAPWSSSGRGLLYTKDLEKRHIEPWLRGIIRSQGSVMGETAYDRILDFATEWECKDGKALFIGVSTFTTSDRGKYKSNIVAPQENIVSFILQQIDIHGKGNNLSEIIKRQFPECKCFIYVAEFFGNLNLFVSYVTHVHDERNGYSPV